MSKDFMITVYCPNCGASIQTEEMMGAKRIGCPECGHGFLITRSELEKYVMPQPMSDRERFEEALADYRYRKSMGFPERRNGGKGSSGSSEWNGFSDPDDFPSDGYGSNDW